MLAQMLLRPGSPPRVREKHYCYLTTILSVGITPACAGKTSMGCQSGRNARDHPRVCGKNQKMYNVQVKLQDHPRVCGKNIVNISFVQLILGSPPRVREKQNIQNNTSDVRRITPACAGKTRLVGCSTL